MTKKTIKDLKRAVEYLKTEEYVLTQRIYAIRETIIDLEKHITKGEQENATST